MENVKNPEGKKKEKGKAVRLQKIRKQGERTSELRKKNDDLLFGEKDVR